MNKYKHLTLIRSGQTIKQDGETCNPSDEYNSLKAYFDLIKQENEILVKRIEYLETQSKTNGVRLRQK